MTAIFLSDVHLLDAGSVKQTGHPVLPAGRLPFESIISWGSFTCGGTSAHLVDLQAGHTDFEAPRGRRPFGAHRGIRFYLGDYFSDALGIQVYTDTITEEWNAARLHGPRGIS